MYGLAEPWWGFNYMLFILIGGLVLLCLWVDFVIVGVGKLRESQLSQFVPLSPHNRKWKG